MTITERLIPLLQRPISDADRRRAALLVLDWTGCAAAGHKEPAGQKITAAFAAQTGRCARIGMRPSSLLMAALHNGCLGNVLEMDDVDKRAVLHAAPTIIPAALAAAQHMNASASQFLDAIVKGYEATIRIGRAVGPGHYAFWHNTATCGPFGAAIAACHVLEGSDPVSALGLAGTQAAGLWQTRHESASDAKQLHAGHAAHAGVLSAMLSAQGFQGPRSILEGEQGFFAAMCPGADPEDILGGPGDDWLINQTSIKPYPACRHTHAAIDAALAMHSCGKPIAGDVLVETYSDALKFCDRPDPVLPIEAKFSLQYCVGVILKTGRLTLADFTPEAIKTHMENHAAHNIWVKATPEFEDVYPAHYGAKISSGEMSFTAKDAYGDPENPMAESAVITKAAGLLAHSGMDARAARKLCDAALNLSGGGALNSYIGLFP